MQKPFVRQFLAKVFLHQAELSLVANEFLPATLDPGGQCDRGDGGKAKAKIIGITRSPRRIGKQLLRR